MTPPAHLLPLALLACEDLDACEVLEDALLECDWWAMPRSLPRLRMLMWEYATIELITRPLTRTTARAIAAVLLFGEWSTEPWPLVSDRQSGRTTRQLQRMLAQLQAHPNNHAVYIVHNQAMRQHVMRLLESIETELPAPVLHRCWVESASTDDDIARVMRGRLRTSLHVDHAWYSGAEPGGR